MEHGQKRRETWRRRAEEIACVNENNERDQSETLESQPPFYIFGKSGFLKLEKDLCGGNLWQRYGLRFMAARFRAQTKARKWGEYKYQLVLYFRRMCDIYTGQKCFNISCRLNEMEETCKPAKRARHSEHQEGTCIRISATSYLKLFMFITYFSYLTRVFLSYLIPDHLTSTPL